MKPQQFSFLKQEHLFDIFVVVLAKCALDLAVLSLEASLAFSD